jgi:hypothetical protein
MGVLSPPPPIAASMRFLCMLNQLLLIDRILPEQRQYGPKHLSNTQGCTCS